MAVLAIEEVLAAEAAELHGGADLRAELEKFSRDQDAHDRRTHLNADERDRPTPDDASKQEAEHRRTFYRSLNRLNRAALCCSGGGIRSATFCLGVIQALAGFDTAALKSHAKSGETKPEHSLLGRFHYLSTVSGGGYVGSWLSAWRARDGLDTVIENLAGRPEGADIEPPEISWLRAYSNYLTPRVGLGSADTWAAAAICVRNMVLNWLIIIPVVCLVLLLLKLIATGSVWIAHNGQHDWPTFAVLGVGILCLIAAQRFTTGHRPSRRDPHAARFNVYERAFLTRDLALAVTSAIAVTIFFSSQTFWWMSMGCNDPATAWSGSAKFLLPAAVAIAALPIYFLGWLTAQPQRRDRWITDLSSWTGAGLVYGALVGLGVYLYGLLDPYTVKTSCTSAAKIACFLVPAIFGVPWVLMSQLTADSVFVGLVSYEANSDADREWLGRAAGWLAAVAIGWMVLAILVFAGAYFVQDFLAGAKTIITSLLGAAGVLSGLATALLGSGSNTPATASDDDQKNVTAIACNIALAIVGPLFAAILITALSIAIDQLMLRDSLVQVLESATSPIWLVAVKLFLAGIVAGAIGLLASYCVNINRFSLHALYRNRLIRAYLGASRRLRRPDHFTGFDPDDSIRVHELWPPKPDGGANHKSLFHVINIALNVVSTKRLAWQERKAESFTVSPLHCGSAYLGFRSSLKYGDGAHVAKQGITHGGAGDHSTAGKKHQSGIALGTAMAISGAAVSPNMGYHSSPSITLILALFNVRLGWWLGNPGKAGEHTYKSEGPTWAAKPLFYEAFGQTTDQSRFVYLSDGGHFENLGLYEMVRRRCRFIVLIDAGCDADFAFEDLGNAVRKIYIDLGIAISFPDLSHMRNRPAEIDPAKAKLIPYCTIGTIDYATADGSSPDENGRILYIKPAYHGCEGAGIRSYAIANSAFPHEATADQWFTESQFESYRSLGFESARHMLDDQAVRNIMRGFLDTSFRQHTVAGAAAAQGTRT